MNNIAGLFPGQGSQRVGMGSELCSQLEIANSYFKRADKALGFSLSSIMHSGPREELTKTYYAQPAILTHSVAVWSCLPKEVQDRFSILVGHSLGEYSALVAACALDFETAVKTVYLRGKFMQEAVSKGKGTMAVVIGLEALDVETVCRQISIDEAKYVAVANFNGKYQTVISGTSNGVAEASLQLKDKGAKRVLSLPVSAPFHCKLMKKAKDKLSCYLDEVNFSNANKPVISNVTGKPMQDKHEIRANLKAQVTSPVYFTQILESLNEMKYKHFVEIGPGKALIGMVKRAITEGETFQIENPQDLNVWLKV